MGGLIPSQTLQEILRRSDVAAVVGRYVQLRRSGRKLVALCPFHQEKTPSFSVDPEKGVWYCFGCQEGGGLFQFLMKMEGLSFRQAALQMAREAGIVVDFSEEASQEDAARARLLELLELAASHYQELLMASPLGQPGRDYLKARAVSVESARRFRLGWAPESGEALLGRLLQAGFTREEGIQGGVLSARGRDLLRGRLVFPIADAQSRVLAFGGRATGEGTPKYLNTPETDLYAKRMHLYGLHLARGPVSRADEAVVVEGYLDVVSLHQAGVQRAVASLGTALTVEQAGLLRRYARKVVLAYDADRAGEAATLKAIDLFEEVGLRASVVRLEPGQDPDSLARRGPEAVEQVLAGAMGVVEFHMDRLEKVLDLNSPEGKEDFVREVLPAIGRIRDSARQDGYIRRLAHRAGNLEEWKLHRRLQRFSGSREPVRRRKRAFSVEERLLHLCATQPQWLGQVREIVSPEMISQEELRPLFSALLEQEGRTGPVPLHELAPHLEEEGMASKWTEVLAQEPLETTPEDLRKLAGSIRDRHLRGRLEALRSEVLPAMEAGLISPEDPRYQEYVGLRRYFGRGAR